MLSFDIEVLLQVGAQGRECVCEKERRAIYISPTCFSTNQLTPFTVCAP